ncbi:MAG: anhydro-N-acetylmuramic acid kinase [Balneolaceae bacterium]
MNKWIKKLAGLAEKPERTVLGLMSGTSMDGMDAALCTIRNSGMDTDFELRKFESVPVELSLRSQFQELAWNPESRVGKVLKFEADLAKHWIQNIDKCLDIWGIKPGEVDLIASHGQTLLHQPDSETGLHTTLQIVDGDHLAAGTGILTVSDFRQKHIAAGFEGAPLAPLGEVLLFTDNREYRVLLNLGGIANFTILPAHDENVEIPFATDCGPANTLMDEAVKRLLPGQTFDPEGSIARRGKVNEKLLEQFLSHKFFDRNFPKSTGQEEFNWSWVEEMIRPVLSELKTPDLLATLAELTAVTVARAIRENMGEGQDFVVYVSGGGWNNRTLIERLRFQLPETKFRSSSELGIDPEAKEAVLFAVFANELVAGNGWITGNGERLTIGKISLP